jgi:hypothetical protein
MELVGFTSGMYQDASISVDRQECVNWYPEVTNANAKSSVILRPTPGLLLFSQSSVSAAVRGLFYTSTGRLFAVSYNQVYELDSVGGRIECGVLATTEGPVNMADNGNQVILVDGLYGYIINLNTGVLSQITNLAFPGHATHVQFINGRFVVNKTTDNQYNLWWSDLYNGNSWDGLSVGSAEGYADKLIAIVKANNQLWLFGSHSFEVFYGTGESDAPFRRVEGALFENGTAAAHSPAVLGTSVFWLGSNLQGQGVVWQADEYAPRRISNHAIEAIITGFSRIDDAVGFCYQQRGHTFYVLTFPTANRTLVYDSTTNFWHERAAYNAASGLLSRYRPVVCAAAFNKILVGSCEVDAIYRLDPETYTDDGNLVKRIRTSPHIYNEMKQVFYWSFELDAEKGVGLVSGEGQRPRFSLQWSNDGGYTWGSEIWRSAGLIGQYNTRIVWRNLGRSRDRLFRVTCSDPVPCTLLAAHITTTSEG